MKQEILNTYEKASQEYGYNSNSLHKLGLNARKLEQAASNQILETLSLTNHEVIYTSGNQESITMLINNYKNKFSDKDKNQITTEDLENKLNYINVELTKKYKDLNKYDFITIEDEIPFFGVLIKRKNINLENLIHGGKSTTNYRSGTSVTPLIASFSKLVKLKYKK